jgi:hypothetical protein
MQTKEESAPVVQLYSYWLVGINKVLECHECIAYAGTASHFTIPHRIRTANVASPEYGVSVAVISRGTAPSLTTLQN